jgi:hypothetical protein
MATFKTEQEIYDDIVAYATAQLPALTNWSAESIEYAIARLNAYAQSMAWKVNYIIYENIWPTTGDAAGLRNWYEVFGITWVGEATDEARRTVLATFRDRMLGTAGWYEATAVDQFDDVTEAHFFAGIRGVNTCDLLILHSGGDCLEATVTAVQAYFDNVNRKVVAIELRVITYKDMEALMELLADAPAV